MLNLNSNGSLLTPATVAFAAGRASFNVSSSLPQRVAVQATLAVDPGVQAAATLTFYLDAHYIVSAPASALVGSSEEVRVQVRNRAGFLLSSIDANLELQFSGSASGITSLIVISGEGTTRIRDFVAEDVQVQIASSSRPDVGFASSAAIRFISGKFSVGLGR